MKRVIFILILCAFLFSLLLAFSIVWLKSAQWQLEIAFNNTDEEEYREAMRIGGLTNLRNGLLSLLGCICSLILFALFSVKEFKIFQPFVDKLAAKHNARKQERIAHKQEKAETEKQKRIEELQAELKELKKDE